MDIHSVTTQEILERISRHCPSSLSTYLQCLNRANAHGFVFFSRTMIDQELSEDWIPFCRRIKTLARENLLSWVYLDKGIGVTLIDYE